MSLKLFAHIIMIFWCLLKGLVIMIIYWNGTTAKSENKCNYGERINRNNHANILEYVWFIVLPPKVKGCFRKHVFINIKLKACIQKESQLPRQQFDKNHDSINSSDDSHSRHIWESIFLKFLIVTCNQFWFSQTGTNFKLVTMFGQCCRYFFCTKI